MWLTCFIAGDGDVVEGAMRADADTERFSTGFFGGKTLGIIGAAPVFGEGFGCGDFGFGENTLGEMTAKAL